MKYFLVLILSLFSISLWAQSKMDLEDLDVKGELLGDDRIQMLERQQNQLKNFVKYRTHFRKEIVEELEKPYPKYIYNKTK